METFKITPQPAPPSNDWGSRGLAPEQREEKGWGHRGREKPPL